MVVEIGGAVTCLVAGTIMLVVFSGLTASARHRRGTGVLVPGTVVGSETRRTRGGTLFEAPVVEFRDSGGAPHRFVRPTGTPHPPASGRPVQVRYDPARPDVGATVEGDRLMTLFRVVLAVAGGLLVLVGGVLLGAATGLW